jgi:hypothetical protein
MTLANQKQQHSGYFADPDGYLWEVCWNPHFPLAEDGTVVIP